MIRALICYMLSSLCFLYSYVVEPAQWSETKKGTKIYETIVSSETQTGDVLKLWFQRTDTTRVSVYAKIKSDYIDPDYWHYRKFYIQFRFITVEESTEYIDFTNDFSSELFEKVFTDKVTYMRCFDTRTGNISRFKEMKVRVKFFKDVGTTEVEYEEVDIPVVFRFGKQELEEIKKIFKKD